MFCDVCCLLHITKARLPVVSASSHTDADAAAAAVAAAAFWQLEPRALNWLPKELKLLRSTDLFRHDLKTVLFDSVYWHQDTD